MACLDVCPPASELSVIKKNIACPEQGCGKIFNASSALTMHLTKHHHNSCLVKRDSSITVRYFCPEENCVYHVQASRHFTQMKYLKQHYLKVHFEKKFSCDMCSKAFATEDLLHYHHQTCGIKFVCSCGNSYSSYEALLTHSKRKQHPFDNWFKTKNSRRTKSNNNNISKEENACASVDGGQPIYILPKVSSEPISGVPVNMLAAVALTELSGCSSSFVLDKAMQTDVSDPRRNRKTASPSKTSDKALKWRTSAQTQTGGTFKSRQPKHTAETQTVGDYILKKAMEEANIQHKDGEVSQRASYARKRKNSTEAQATSRKVPKSAVMYREQAVELHNIGSLVQVSPSSSPSFPKDIGLPDLWLSHKITSSTQTSLKSRSDILPIEDRDGTNIMQTDLNLEFFGQDGGLGPPSNLQCLFEDNSDSFDNVVSSTAHFDASAESGNMNTLMSLPDYSTCIRSCNMETQTDQAQNQIIPSQQSSDSNNGAQFALSSTSETQTTSDLADLDSLLYSNMCTQTCDDMLFSDLDFVDIQTQTAWPCYNEESNESILVSTETQTAISTFSLNVISPDNCNKSLINDASNHETQTNEDDLKDLMAELDEQEANKQIL